jgi:hypothetical protein
MFGTNRPLEYENLEIDTLILCNLNAEVLEKYE